MPKFKLFLNPGDEDFKIIDTDTLSPEEKKLLRQRLEEGKVHAQKTDLSNKKEVAEYQLKADNPNRINYIDFLSPETREKVKSFWLPEDVDRRVQGAVLRGGANVKGGPIGMGLGAVAGFVDPPQTISDLAIEALGGGAGAWAGKRIAQAGGGLLKQMVGQGAANYGTSIAEDSAKKLADVALDPNRNVSDYTFAPTGEDLRNAIIPGLFGMAGAGVDNLVKSRMSRSPVVKSMEAGELATGQKIQNPDELAKYIEDVQAGRNPSAASVIAPERTKVIKTQKDLEDAITREKRFKADADRDIAFEQSKAGQATRENKAEEGRLRYQNMARNPELEANHTTIGNAQVQLKRIANLEQKIKDESATQLEMREFMALHSQGAKQQAENSIRIAQNNLDKIQEQAKARAEEALLRRYEVNEYTDQQTGKVTKIPENQASLDAKTQAYKLRAEKAEETNQILALQQKAREKTYPLDPKNILMSGNNAEEVVKNLMTRDVPQIKSFMNSFGEKKEIFQKAVINEILSQSYDSQSKTFSNFQKLYGTQGTAGNVLPKLAEVFGDQDKAKNFIELMSSIDAGIKSQQMLEKRSKQLAGVVGTTLLLSMFAGKLYHPNFLGAEAAALTAVSLPMLVNKSLSTKGGYEMLKKWADSGFNEEIMKKGNPLFQMIMKSGDHYIVDSNGNTRLVEKD